jgi:glycosyltransferase involved in cell wall biosynthesis
MNWQERWKPASVELAAPLAELACEPGYAGIRAVFFWNGVALGHCRIAAAQLPLAPRQLASIASAAVAQAVGDYLVADGFHSALPGLPEPAPADAVGALESLLAIERPLAELKVEPRPNPENPTITVAICTRERPNDLERCMTSLKASTERPFEILVIDNAPESDSTRRVVERFPGVEYYREVQRGLSAARNAALEQARGEIVAFIDDDAIAHPSWIERALRAFADPEVMVVTGLVLPAELDTPAQRIFEETYRFFHHGYRRRRFDSAYFARLKDKGAPVWSIGAGVNMAIRRKAYEQGLRFDTRLGPGVFGGCGEDSEFWYRVLARGWSCVYDPSLCIYHHHRCELRDLRRLIYQYMKGHVAALILQFANHRRLGDLRRLLIGLPLEYGMLLVRLAASGLAVENRILLRGAAGCIAGLGFAFRLSGTRSARTPARELPYATNR